MRTDQPTQPERSPAEILYGKSNTRGASPAKQPAAADAPKAQTDADVMYPKAAEKRRAAEQARAAEKPPAPAANAEPEQTDEQPQAQPGADQSQSAYSIEPGKADSGMATGYAKAAKELGLGRDVAQKLFDRVAPQIEARNRERLAEQAKAWGKEVRAEHGADLGQNLDAAKSVLRRFGDPELRKMLADTGLADFPPLFRFLSRIGRDMGSEA